MHSRLDERTSSVRVATQHWSQIPMERRLASGCWTFHSAPMRAFHLSWFAFFLSFVAWFGIAPLMAVVRDDLKLTKAQIGNTVIASVAITIFARLLTVGCAIAFGPRRTYSALLVFGALPVMGIGLSHSYHSFLLFRLAIGLIGASFVLTQYHTSIMFSPIGRRHRQRRDGRLGKSRRRRHAMGNATVVRRHHRIRCGQVPELATGDDRSRRAHVVHGPRLLSPHRRHSRWQALRAANWCDRLSGKLQATTVSGCSFFCMARASEWKSPWTMLPPYISKTLFT